LLNLDPGAIFNSLMGSPHFSPRETARKSLQLGRGFAASNALAGNPLPSLSRQEFHHEKVNDPRVVLRFLFDGCAGS
jgi:hypothetical protein